MDNLEGVKNTGNGSFVLDLTEGREKDVQPEKISAKARSSAEKEKGKATRATKPRSGEEPDGTRMCVWFDAASARAFRTAKMVYENATGSQETNGSFLLALLDGKWEKLPPSTKKFFRDFLEMSRKK